MRSFILKRSVALLLTAVAMLFSFCELKAQVRFNETMLTDLGGKPIYVTSEYIYEGSPYFPEGHTKCIIVLKSGKTYDGINSKMSFYDNCLIVLKDDGTELMLKGSISKVTYEMVPVGSTFRTVIFQRGFPAVDKLDSTTYYEVLDSGKLMLLKHTKVTYTDRKGYGEASITRVFTKKESYYMLLPGNIIKPLEKGKQEFLSLLPDRKDELGKYIDDKKLKCKKEEDWTDLVSYYNSF